MRLEARYLGRFKSDRIYVAFGVPLPVGREAEDIETDEPFLELVPGTNGIMQITVLSSSLKPGLIQRSTNLVDWADWKYVTPLNGMETVTDTEAAGGLKHFYRMVER